jgi:hypothetical protein
MLKPVRFVAPSFIYRVKPPVAAKAKGWPVDLVRDMARKSVIRTWFFQRLLEEHARRRDLSMKGLV